MSKRKYTLLSFVLVLVLVFSNVFVCYALEFDVSKYPTGNTSYEYQEQIGIHGYDKESDTYIKDEYSYFTISGESEIVAYCYYIDVNGEQVEKYALMSLGSFIAYQYMEYEYNNGWTNTATLDNYCVGNDEFSEPCVTRNLSGNAVYNEFMYNSIYVFESGEYALQYLKTGSTAGLKYNKSKQYESDKIYLNNYRVIYHDSNIFENCYIEVKYDLPEYITDNIDDSYLQVSGTYNCDCDVVSGSFELEGENDMDFSFSESYSFNSCGKGLNIYLKDIVPEDNKTTIRKNMMLGDELYIDFDYIGLDVFARIVVSSLYLTFTPCVNNSAGLQYDAQIDLLNPSNTTYYSSTPDSTGNYTPNGDYTQGDGYYTTIVGTDGQGNNTYNYYYYDNSTHTTVELDPSFDTDTDVDVDVGGSVDKDDSGVLTILWGNSLNIEGEIVLDGNISGSGGAGGSGGDVTINGSGDNIDLTIEDDDYTDNALREDLKDGFGLLDNLDTEQSNDGFLSMCAGFLEHLDGELDDVLVFGMSSVVAIAILRMILRR